MAETRPDGSCTMGDAIVPLFRPLGDKLDPSTSHNLPESPYLLSAIEAQSHLI